MENESLFDRRVHADEPPRLGRLSLLHKDSLTDWQRLCLRYYLETQHKDVSAALALRFHMRYLIFWAVATAILSVLALLLIPAATVCSLRYSILAILVAMFLTQWLYLIWQAQASFEHWRLLRSIIDWDAVARLTDNDALPDSTSDGGPK